MRHVVMLAPFGLRPKATLTQRMLPLAAALVEHGWRCTIIAPAYLHPADAGRRETLHGVQIEHVQLPRLPGPLEALETSARMLLVARRHEPDLLHAFKPKGYSGLAAQMAHVALPHLPLVQDTDDWEGWGGWNDLLPYSQPMKQFFAWQERTLPRWADTVTVASRTLESQVWGFGIDPNRVIYLPNGVPQQPPILPEREGARHRLQLGHEPVVLLYTRFWEYPLQDIIEVLLVLHTRHPEARLLVIGDGEQGEAAALRALADRTGVGQMLNVRGWVDQAVIDDALAAADLAIAPFADTLMNRAKCSAKLLQILQAGVPLVASRVGQAQEYVRSGVTGLLVEPGGVPLAEGVLRLLEDPTWRHKLGVAAQSDVTTRWNWSLLAERAEHAYHLALERT